MRLELRRLNRSVLRLSLGARIPFAAELRPDLYISEMRLLMHLASPLIPRDLGQVELALTECITS
jgi:hypothetical protein